MSQYADVTYYKNSYKGTIIPDEELEQRLNRASRDIDSLTYNRIVKSGFDKLTSFQQGVIRDCVCQHADFIQQYGPMIDSPISGYSAGSTSVSFKDLNVSGQNGVFTTQSTFQLLKQTNLTSRLFL